MKTPNFTPDRLNEQPAVMRGCSWPELYSILLKSVLFSLPLSLLLAVFLDNYSSILASLPVFISIFFWGLTARMANLKNGRPVGYFTVRSALKKQRRGGGKFFVEHEGYWKISKD
jgi:conjugative transfer region protein (TIGR03750 family)